MGFVVGEYKPGTAGRYQNNMFALYLTLNYEKVLLKVFAKFNEIKNDDFELCSAIFNVCPYLDNHVIVWIDHFEMESKYWLKLSCIFMLDPSLLIICCICSSGYTNNKV